MSVNNVRAGFLRVDGEIKEIFVESDTGQVTFRHELDEVTYELEIPVADAIEAQPSLFATLEKGEFGEAIGVIISREGFYVIVDKNVAELRPLSNRRGAALEKFNIDLYIEAEVEED